MKNIFYKIVFHYRLLGRDKLEHFYSGAIGFAILSVLINPLVASCIVGSVAVAKELINDLVLDKGNPEVLDALFSCLPFILYWLIVLI